MWFERVRPTVLRVTLHPLELATLVSAARWAAEGAEDPLPPEALDRLRQVLASYDAATSSGLDTTRPPAG